jgi:hypothetical protein
VLKEAGAKAAAVKAAGPASTNSDAGKPVALKLELSAK